MKAALLLAFAVAATSCSDAYERMAEQKVDEVTIRVGLNPMHPWLAEYRRFLEVERVGQTQKKELFPDTGGYTWVALFNNFGVLEVKSFNGLDYSVPIESLPKNMRLYLGRFDFDSRHDFKFIPASSDPREPEPPK